MAPTKNVNEYIQMVKSLQYNAYNNLYKSFVQYLEIKA